MAPTQPFKARARKTPAERPTERTKPAGETNRTGHRSEPDSRGEHKKAKRNRKYDVVKKLDVGTNLDAVSGSDDEYGSDLDLDKPLYSIGEYLSERSAMVRNMFASLKKDTLHKMVPAVLWDFSLVELEEKCVFELDGMSRKRVRAILSGQDLQSSSGTDDSEDEPAPASRAQQPGRKALSPAQSIPDSVSSSAGSLADSVSPCNTPAAVAKPPIPAPASDGLCMAAVESTELELLELELRAQALRAMMDRLENDEDISRSPVGSRSDTDIMLDEALEEGEVFDADDGESKPKKRAEGDFFEIHVDEEELAGFE